MPDLSMPEAFAKGLSLFPQRSIGFKGSAAVTTRPDMADQPDGGAGTAFSFLIPSSPMPCFARRAGSTA